MLIATDPLSLTFITCFLFGLLFLVVTALLGSIGHGHVQTSQIHFGNLHFGSGAPVHGATHPASAHTSGGGDNAQGNFSLFSIINPNTVVFFLLGFGFFGYVFHNNAGLGLSLTLLLAIVSGLIIAVLLVMLINRLVGSTEGHTEQDVSDRIGLVGKVIMTIREDGLGEILYETPGGLRKSIPARSTDNRRIERDQEVVVLSYQKGVAEVDTWEHFINQEGTESAELPSADDLTSLQALLDEAGQANPEYVLRKDPPKE